MSGRRLGELVLKAALRWAASAPGQPSDLLVEVDAKLEKLIEFLIDFSFSHAVSKSEKRDEHIYLKELDPPADSSLDGLAHHIAYGPPAVRGGQPFGTSVTPAWYEDLFPEARGIGTSAEGIMDRRKRVEFRKRRLSEDIETVLVYATAPVSKVVGRFTIDEMVSGTPSDIWDRFRSVGVIERDAFFSYFGGRNSAVAIVVASAQRFDDPLALDDMVPRPAIPQSFSYLPSATPALAAAR